MPSMTCCFLRKTAARLCVLGVFPGKLFGYHARAVLLHRQGWNQIIDLKHKAHRGGPVVCQGIACEGGDIRSVYDDLTAMAMAPPISGERVKNSAFHRALFECP